MMSISCIIVGMIINGDFPRSSEKYKMSQLRSTRHLVLLKMVKFLE